MLTCTVSAHSPVPARYTRCASIFLRSIFLRSFSLNIPIRYRWTKIDSGTKLSLGRGRSPKRIVAHTRPNPGRANIAGFVPPTSFAWSNTGADCDRSQHNPHEPPPPRRLLLDDQGSAAPSPIRGRSCDAGFAMGNAASLLLQRGRHVDALRKALTRTATARHPGRLRAPPI
jgi:hypothetical protein